MCLTTYPLQCMTAILVLYSVTPFTDRSVAGHPVGQISESPLTQQRPTGSSKTPNLEFIESLSKKICSAFIFTKVC